jgi:hypothetical protein
VDPHDPTDVALGRSAIESGIIDRSDASRILAIATAGRCGFVEAARRLGLSPSVVQRLGQVRPPSSGSGGKGSSGSRGAAEPSSKTRTSSVTASRGALAKRIAPGATFGGHVIERTLGQGGMGVVLLGKDPAGTSHAIKVPFFDANAEDRRKRFIRESQALAKLDHPGIVKVHGAGEEDGAPFCVMELVLGDALDALLEKGPLDVPRALEIAEEVARALEHAHAAGIVHRDVKPSNIMLRQETGRAILMDFGLAQDDEAERLTKTGAMLGTPRYMAPEQAAGSGAGVDGRADVYSLGATLFELVVGTPVFEADSAIALVGKIMSEPARAPSEARPGIPRGLDAIVLRALEKSPDDRYATALDMAEDLARARKGETVGERPRLRARRRRIVAAVLGALALAGAGVGIAVTQAARRSAALRHAEKRQEAHDAVVAQGEPWRRARFGLEPGSPDAFAAACARFDEANRGDASDAIAAEVARTRAIVDAERALARNDKPAARAALENASEGSDRQLLLLLAQDDPASSRKALDALAREVGDLRLRTEAGLALVRLETAIDPQGALRRLDALPPPTFEDARQGEKALRKQALAACAERSARDGSDQVFETLTVLERLDPAAAKDAALRAVRAALTRVGKDSPRTVAMRLWRLYERDSSSFAQPGLAPDLLRLVAETFAVQELVLTSKCFELAARSDPTTFLPPAIMNGLPSATQVLLMRPGRTFEDLLDLEAAFVRIGEITGLLDSFEDSKKILAGIEKRLAETPKSWALALSLASRTEDHARGLALCDQVLASPETTPRARVGAHVMKANHCRFLRRTDLAIAEAEAGIKGGYGKPDVIECGTAEMLLNLGRFEEAIDWGRRGAKDADDREERSSEGLEALSAGRPPGYPLQLTGAIGSALRSEPRVIVVEALLALQRVDEARTIFEEARVAGGDREAPTLREHLTTFAATLDVKGLADMAAVARELAAKTKKG